MGTWDRFKNQEATGLELVEYTGATFYPRSFCDDPDLGSIGIYVAKAPVCKLYMTPVIQFENTNIAWDISASGSTTSTIDTFDIDWGGTTDVGDLSAQDWSSDPKTGNVQYTTAGTYTVEAYVTDLLGERSLRCKGTIQIISNFVSLGRAYVGTSDGGLFVITPDGTNTAKNTGLTGNHTNFRSVRLHPAFKFLDATDHHVWAATQDGGAYTVDGADNWTVISEATLGTPENAAGDGTPPTATDPDNIDINFDPQDIRRIYMLRTTATRTWLYYSDDLGATWSNEQVSA
jgi:hypothetical protein